MDKLTKIKIWLRARPFDWPYWRVTYQDGTRTHRLFYREAKGLAETFNGRMWIDYTIKY